MKLWIIINKGYTHIANNINKSMQKEGEFKMKKYFRKGLALIISLCLLLSVLPCVTVFASNDIVSNSYGTVQVIAEGGEVELLITDYVTASASNATSLVDSAFSTYNSNHGTELTTTDITKITVEGKDSEQYLVGIDFNAINGYIKNANAPVIVDFSNVNMANGAYRASNLNDTNKNILGSAFRNNGNLKELKLPDTLTQINNNSAFQNCAALESFIFPPNLVVLGDDIVLVDGTNPNRMFFYGTAVKHIECHSQTYSEQLWKNLLGTTSNIEYTSVDFSNSNITSESALLISEDVTYLNLQNCNYIEYTSIAGQTLLQKLNRIKENGAVVYMPDPENMPEIYNVRVLSNDSAMGSVTGNKVFLKEEAPQNCTFTATPTEHYTLLRWNVNGTFYPAGTPNDNGVYTLSLSIYENTVVTAEFVVDIDLPSGQIGEYVDNELNITLNNVTSTEEICLWTQQLVKELEADVSDIEKIVINTADDIEISESIFSKFPIIVLEQLKCSLKICDISGTKFENDMLPISTFSGFSSLTTVILPDDLITIGNSAFQSSGLTQIDLPDGLQRIGASAFRDCTNFNNELSLPDSVTFFGALDEESASISMHSGRFTLFNTMINGFSYHGNGTNEFFEGIFAALNSIGNTLECIDMSNSALTERVAIYLAEIASTQSLKFVDVRGCQIDYSTVYGTMLDKILDNLEITGVTVYRDDGINSAVEPEQGIDLTLTVSADSSLAEQLELYNGISVSNITVITNMTSLSTQDFSALKNLPWLRTLNLKAATCENNTIPFEALRGMTHLETIILPDNIVTIEDYAFKDCSKLKGRIEIPSTVTYIGKQAFFDATFSEIIYHGMANISIETQFKWSIKTIGLLDLRGCKSINENNMPTLSPMLSLYSVRFDYCSFTTTPLLFQTLRQNGIIVTNYHQGESNPEVFESGYGNPTDYYEQIEQPERPDPIPDSPEREYVLVNTPNTNTSVWSVSADATLTVDNERHHDFEKYGYWVNDSDSKAYSKLTAQQKSKINDLIFRDAKVNVLFVGIDNIQYHTSQEYGYDIRDFAERYDLSDPDSIINNALKSGAEIALGIGLIPPDYMRGYVMSELQNKSSNRALLPEYVDDYADMIAYAVYDIKQLGIDVSYVTTGDEPDFGQILAEESIQVIKELRKSLDRLGLYDIKIISTETTTIKSAYMQWLMNDEEAWDSLYAFSGHDFGAGAVGGEFVNLLSLDDKSCWITSAGSSDTVNKIEECIKDDNGNFNVNLAGEVEILDYVRAIKDLGAMMLDLNNGATGFVRWLGIYNNANLQNSTSYLQILLDVNGSFNGDVYALSAAYQYFKQFLSVIEPDAEIFYTTSDNVSILDTKSENSSIANYSLAATVARNADGTWGINLLNKTSSFFYAKQQDASYKDYKVQNGRKLTLNLDIIGLYGSGAVVFNVYKTDMTGARIQEMEQITLINGRGYIEVEEFQLVSLRSVNPVNTFYNVYSVQDITKDTIVMMVGEDRVIDDGNSRLLHQAVIGTPVGYVVIPRISVEDLADVLQANIIVSENEIYLSDSYYSINFNVDSNVVYGNFGINELNHTSDENENVSIQSSYPVEKINDVVYIPLSTEIIELLNQFSNKKISVYGGKGLIIVQENAEMPIANDLSRYVKLFDET